MALGSKRFMETRFLGVAYRPLELFCDALVEIFDESHTESVEWDPENGLTKQDHTPVWKGWASITPNKDWRARTRVWGEEATATHAYRVQLHHLDQNLLVEKADRGKPELRVKFGEGQRLRIVAMTSDTRATGLKMVVRNAVTDNNMWQPTLLCDIDAGDQKLGENE